MSSFMTTPTSDPSKVCQDLGKAGLRGHKRTFTALLLSSQAPKLLHIHNSQVVNYFFMIYRDKHLAIMVTDQGTKKTEFKKP